eukprot:m.24347 g.24347  ORF g.24347 m.24347 type:complete len:309 (+) comp7601_c0_seq1:187-1113(+)
MEETEQNETKEKPRRRLNMAHGYIFNITKHQERRDRDEMIWRKEKRAPEKIVENVNSLMGARQKTLNQEEKQESNPKEKNQFLSKQLLHSLGPGTPASQEVKRSGKANARDKKIESESNNEKIEVRRERSAQDCKDEDEKINRHRENRSKGSFQENVASRSRHQRATPKNRKENSTQRNARRKGDGREPKTRETKTEIKDDVSNAERSIEKSTRKEPSNQSQGKPRLRMPREDRALYVPKARKEKLTLCKLNIEIAEGKHAELIICRGDNVNMVAESFGARNNMNASQIEALTQLALSETQKLNSSSS